MVYRRFCRALGTPRNVTASAYSFLRISPPVWGLLNRAGNILHKAHPPQLDQLQHRVVNELVRDGIAVTHLDELFPGGNLISDMNNHLDLRDQESTVGIRKTFLRYAEGDLSGETPTIDLESPFIRLSLNPKVLDIVNSYINTCSKLIHFELSTTNLMSAGSAPGGSQRWHRDPGMKRLIKIFLYLTDVDEDSGPFTYLLQSHAGGRNKGLFPRKQFGRHGVYPPEVAVDKVVPKNDIKGCIGKAGTVIFCDTSGLHKGGYSISRPRVMFTAVYYPEGDIQQRTFTYPTGFKERASKLNAVSRYAVAMENTRNRDTGSID